MPTCKNHFLNLGFLVAALGGMPGVWADTITGPSALHVNLGFIPFESYHDQAMNGTTMPNCDPGNTVPQCFQEIFSAYAAQGVTGVRFFFTLNGGWLSNPLDPSKRDRGTATLTQPTCN